MVVSIFVCCVNCVMLVCNKFLITIIIVDSKHKSDRIVIVALEDRCASLFTTLSAAF